jgi:small subunit ribosomal protein S36
VGYWLGRFAEWMPERFWGSFGHFEVRLPGIAIIAATAALALLLAVGLWVRRRGDAGLVLIAFAPLPALVALSGARAFDEFRDTGQAAGIQGRYLFPALVGAAAVASVGIDRLPTRWRARAPLAAVIAAGLMQLAALKTILPYYWGPPGSSVGTHVRALVDWAPWPPAIVAAIAVAAAAAGAALMWSAIRLARGPAAAPTS